RASRVRVSALKSVDLPTLGRPTRATRGSIGAVPWDGWAGKRAAPGSETTRGRWDPPMRGSVDAPGAQVAVDVLDHQDAVGHRRAAGQRRAARAGARGEV